MPRANRYTIADIRAANAAAGYFFFSRNTMKFFGSVVISGPYHGLGGITFCTREAVRGSDGDMRTTYTARQFHPDTGRVTTLEPSQLRTLDEAKEIAQEAAHHVDADA